MLERLDFSLMIVSISISMFKLEGNWAIVEWKVYAEECENCLFTNSLIGATIQDRGKRERSDVDIILY